MLGRSRAEARRGVILSVVLFVALGGCQLVADLNRFDIVDPAGGGSTSEGGNGGGSVGGEGGTTSSDGGGGQGGQGGDGGLGGQGGQGGQDPCPGPTGTLFVDGDATGAGDGSSWTDAYTALSAALAYAEQCGNGEIWVAEGRYVPGAAATDSFALQSGLSVLGGFAGSETMATERDPGANMTVLSGDIGNDDDDVAGVVLTPADIVNTNAQHVVTASGVDATAVLDGFTITAGDAQGAGTDNGGGIEVGSGSPTLRDLVFQGNRAAAQGGGIWSSSGALDLDSVDILNNDAATGGGVYATGGTVDLTGVLLEGNTCTTEGAGAAVFSAALSAQGLDVISNTAGGDGGGLYLSGGSASFIDVYAAGNDSGDRGGFLRTVDGTQDFTNAVFSGNFATTSGGAVYLGGTADTTLTNVTIQGNRSAVAGGVHNAASAGTIVIQNSILWFNEDGTAPSTLAASLVNTTQLPTIRHSVVEGAGTSAVDWVAAAGNDDGGNADVLPDLVTPTVPAAAPTISGDHRLLVTSLAIDLGDTTLNATATDLGGGPRDHYADIDAGAYEVVIPCAAVTFVNDDAAGNALGGSWTDAFTNLRFALRHVELCAQASAQVWVAAGVYKPHAVDPSVSFELRNNVAIYGGFAGGEADLGMRDPAVNFSVLSGDIDADDTADASGIVQHYSDQGGGNGNSFHVLRADGVDATAILDGVVVTAGDADGANPDDRGAGLLVTNSAVPTLTSLTFSGNTASHGGGIYHNDSTTLTVNGVTFRGNNATHGGGVRSDNGSLIMTDVFAENNNGGNQGGVIRSESSTVEVTRGVFRSNTANQGGAGARIRFANSTWTDVLFEGNSGNGFGGALFVLFSTHVFSNVAFLGNNSGTSRAGAFYLDRGPCTMTNVVFHGNKGQLGGGMYFDNGGQALTFTNTIFWDNIDNTTGTPQDGSIAFTNAGNAKFTASYSLIQGSGGSSSWDINFGVDGGNNIDADPEFVTPIDPDLSPLTGADVHLKLTPLSPALDAGTTGTAFDIDGVVMRPQGAGPDMGIWEQ